jgi:hypothetical protein
VAYLKQGEDEEPLYVQVWQIVPRHATLGELEGKQQ